MKLEDQADVSWLWKEKFHAKLIDANPNDTARSQCPTRRKIKLDVSASENSEGPVGCGQPIARAVAILSLATACVMDVSIAPYSGKETGESALLRAMLLSLCEGDIAVMDRYYCSLMMICVVALARSANVRTQTPFTTRCRLSPRKTIG